MVIAQSSTAHDSPVPKHHVVPDRTPVGGPITELQVGSGNASPSLPDEDSPQGHETNFSFSLDGIGVNKSIDDIGNGSGVDDQGKCCGCCCTRKTRNLYCMSIQEYSLFIKDDFDCKIKCAASDK
eukprot:CAMPEP_0201583798 /NCGR_PEP_ID=MMETSP0190_2-20130828/102681_1 /ASSEMBLY_ACC=CAM_ASM_000263 /TAXON_ID=37353 /ORGANISM="Rosalina sp." /LENGTH=124 /DNA_ID=CAMNT_0048026405 /DNA_START=274 /DNA_END=648 /DNA_ORIENTATION=+